MSNFFVNRKVALCLLITLTLMSPGCLSLLSMRELMEDSQDLQSCDSSDPSSLLFLRILRLLFGLGFSSSTPSEIPSVWPASDESELKSLVLSNCNSLPT